MWSFRLRICSSWHRTDSRRERHRSNTSSCSGCNTGCKWVWSFRLKIDARSRRERPLPNWLKRRYMTDNGHGNFSGGIAPGMIDLQLCNIIFVHKDIITFITPSHKDGNLLFTKLQWSVHTLWNGRRTTIDLGT